MPRLLNYQGLNTRLFLLIIFIALTPSLCRATENIKGDPTVTANGQVIKYFGDVNSSGLKKLKEVYSRHPKATTLQIGSVGGAARDGISIGEFVHKHKLNVEVKIMCASSCANFIFPAGREKRLGQHSYLIFHGGACSLPIEEFETPSINIARAEEHVDFWKTRNKLIAEMIKSKQKKCDLQLNYYQKLGSLIITRSSV